MTDMLVKLYDLPPLTVLDDVIVRRALAVERQIVSDWVGNFFSSHWASECNVVFGGHPISCFVAIHNQSLAGFACYDATLKGFFGPTGVLEAMRGRGIGRCLLLACLHDMVAQGYGYAIIGGVGPADFYKKAVNATVIAGSIPGVYHGMLRD